MQLGAYEIISLIGAGGMGEVYRARDTRLDRTVAIKVLPEALAADPQLRERFDREARAISSLNHPHICALYDVGHQEGVDFLVLEYLEGQSLAERLPAGPVPVLEALKIAVDICDALDKAHRSGIVHRDLKPANVMLTRAGAKLLDFGLARSEAPVVTTSGLSMLPTTPPNLTVQGAILGTFQYMAPEQIEGLEADARTDIFAFGALLFEMLTGRPAFEGKTRASLLGAILKDEPPRISTVQPLAPAALDRIICTCLAKDPDDRYQSARDLLRELRWVASAGADGPMAPPSAAPNRAGGSGWIVAGVLAVALLGSTFIALTRPRTTLPVAEGFQFTVSAPEKSRFGGPAGGGTGIATQVAVSPDGRHVVFVATNSSSFALWLRSLGTLAITPLPGTDDGSFPFWSPDSRYIGFFAGGKLKKASLSGGPPITLCDASSGRGGTWNSDNVIVFGTIDASPLRRVSAAGGIPTAVTSLDAQYGETNHRFPHFLPDGRHFLFTAITGPPGVAPKSSLIKIGAVDSMQAATLTQAESSAAYGSGHLMLLRDSSLMAQPFDITTRQLNGDPFPIAEQVSTEGSRYAGFSVSPTGTLVYARGGAPSGTELTWYDRTGTRLATAATTNGFYSSVALSPNEQQAAVTLTSGTPVNHDVWVIDLARSVPSRLTHDPAADRYPVWSPDGARIAFQAIRGAGGGMRVQLASGTVNDEPLLTADAPATELIPSDWSRDGRFLAFMRPVNGQTDIWILPQSGDRKPFAFVASRFMEGGAQFSPDGRWIAYHSYESGRPQIYVQPFPASGGKYQVSNNGGVQPLWRGDGRELFFIGLDRDMMAATIDSSNELKASVPQALFLSGITNTTSVRQYAVARDGQKFLIVTEQAQAATLPLTVVVNWPATIPK